MSADLRKLLAEATPGPWKAILPGDLSWDTRKQYRCVAFSTKRDESYTTSPLLPFDARLIVAAVNALPALLDRLDALTVALRDIALMVPGSIPLPMTEEEYLRRMLHECASLAGRAIALDGAS